jgi:hypothetical protein
MMSEATMELEIQSKGLNAPRLTPTNIDSVIYDTKFHIIPGTTVTVCCLVLENGFTVIGSSASASPENFDQDIGRKIAYANARDKIWDLEGYLLKQRMFEAKDKK